MLAWLLVDPDRNLIEVGESFLEDGRTRVPKI